MILFVDCETSGFDPLKDSILSIAFGCLNDEIKHMYVKEKNYRINDEAEKVNGISKETIEEEGKDPELVVAWLEAYILERLKGKDKVILTGHNVKFDIGFLQRLYRKADAPWPKFFDYHSLCTVALSCFYREHGMIPADVKLKLVTLCEHFKIELNPHDAKNDLVATMNLYQTLGAMLCQTK